MQSIPETTLAEPVAGVNVVPGTLRDQLAPGDTLLVFLRHFGCIFCRETVADLRAVSESDPDFPKVLFFFQGSPTEGPPVSEPPVLPALRSPNALRFTSFRVASRITLHVSPPHPSSPVNTRLSRWMSSGSST